MLVLSRKPGESIVINKDIKISYFGSSQSGTAKIGIEAPDDVRVLREELIEKTETQDQEPKNELN